MTHLLFFILGVCLGSISWEIRVSRRTSRVAAASPSPQPPAPSLQPLSSLPASRSAHAGHEMWTGCDCRGIHHRWKWHYGDWEPLLASMAQRIAAENLCVACAGQMILAICMAENESEVTAQALFNRLRDKVLELMVTTKGTKSTKG